MTVCASQKPALVPDFGLKWKQFCTALHCTALHCTVLHCTALHCTVLHCTTLHCTELFSVHCTLSRTVSHDGCFQWLHSPHSPETLHTINLEFRSVQLLCRPTVLDYIITILLHSFVLCFSTVFYKNGGLYVYLKMYLKSVDFSLRLLSTM